MSEKTMFRVTAANCKQWADEVNSDKYSALLEEIATEARAGKYFMYYTALPDTFRDKLDSDGFRVTVDKLDNVALISWQ